MYKIDTKGKLFTTAVLIDFDDIKQKRKKHTFFLIVRQASLALSKSSQRFIFFLLSANLICRGWQIEEENEVDELEAKIEGDNY